MDAQMATPIEITDLPRAIPRRERSDRTISDMLASIDTEGQAGPKAVEAPVEPPPRTVEDILAERAKTHGDFTDHARITQSIKRTMRSEVGWDRLNDCQRESLEMNAHKVGRILAGNPDVNDHWDDIAGYAKLVSERIKV